MSKQKMINLTIDGKTITVPNGTTVYQAAKQIGIDIPIFCYQDRMPPFGACRMCLVEVEKSPKLQASCTLQATEGMVVNTQSAPALEGRKSIIELLLINHPLDCPICDRGGECPLQEHALEHGSGESRFFEDKRHFTKALPLGPVLMLDRERCIVCARCTRFGDIVAGDHALEFKERGFRSEVGTPDGGPAESKFIGNTIMICPVGALTSQVYRFRARPWDNQPTESTCTLCPVGCSLYLDSRDGQIMRTRSKENKDVNDIWLCDKGWFGYEYTSHPDRLQQPYIRQDDKLKAATWDEALSLIASKIKEAKPEGKLAALGGNPLTVEENYLFQKLMREGAGVNHIDHRIGTASINIEEEGLPPGMTMSIGDTEELSFAVLLGLDLTEEFPVIWLRLKQAINKGAKVIFIGHFAPEIAKHLEKTIIHTPGDELFTFKNQISDLNAFAQNGKGAIFIGNQYLNSPNRKAILSEISKFANSNKLSLNIMEGNDNSMGARFAGMRPDAGPLGQQLNKPGMNALEIIQTASSTGMDFLYIAGADIATHYPSNLWYNTRTKTEFLVVQDLFLTETARQADVILPTLSYVEKGGSFINIEGRVQNLLPGKEIPTGLLSDREIFEKLGEKLGISLQIDSEFLAKLKHNNRVLLPSSISGSGVPIESKGELFATFASALFDRGVRMKHNTKLGKLAKEPKIRIHPEEARKRSIKDGEKVKVKSEKGEVTGKIAYDDGVAAKTIVLPLGFDQVFVHDLGDTLYNGMPVTLSK
jgi:NADH-quinone oxidoreductase subunit G